jgi:ethanolamine ammonia-lyase large subunit
MGMASRGARISPQDVADLNLASEDVAACAQLIQRNRPSYEAAAVQLLVRANTTIVRIQQKGAAAYARYLERHGLQDPSGIAESAAPGETIENQESTIGEPKSED